MENKQKAIEKAYGEHWEAVKDYVDENGWVKRKDIKQIDLVICDLFDVKTKYFTDLKENDTVLVIIRPKSLQGIETNNGWIKIESEDDLPNKSCSCWIDVDGKETNTPFWFNLNYKTFHFQGVFYTYNEVSDYQIVERPKQKVY